MMAPQCLKVSMFILLMHANINVIMVCHYYNCILQQYMPKPPFKTLPYTREISVIYHGLGLHQPSKLSTNSIMASQLTEMVKNDH